MLTVLHTNNGAFSPTLAAGALAEFSDEAYKAAGARIASGKETLGQDVILKIRPPTMNEVAAMKQGVRLVRCVGGVSAGVLAIVLAGILAGLVCPVVCLVVCVGRSVGSCIGRNIGRISVSCSVCLQFWVYGQ